MEGEWTVGMVFEDIADRVALARSKALMGEREEALCLLRCARLDYLRFGDQLEAYPGNLSLRHALETALEAVGKEKVGPTTGIATADADLPKRSEGRSPERAEAGGPGRKKGKRSTQAA